MLSYDIFTTLLLSCLSVSTPTFVSTNRNPTCLHSFFITRVLPKDFHYYPTPACQDYFTRTSLPYSLDNNNNNNNYWTHNLGDCLGNLCNACSMKRGKKYLSIYIYLSYIYKTFSAINNCVLFCAYSYLHSLSTFTSVNCPFYQSVNVLYIHIALIIQELVQTSSTCHEDD